MPSGLAAGALATVADELGSGAANGRLGGDSTTARPGSGGGSARWAGRARTQLIALFSLARSVTRANAMASESRAKTATTQRVFLGWTRGGWSETDRRGARDPATGGAVDKGAPGNRTGGAGAGLGVWGASGSRRVGRLEKVRASGPNSSSGSSRGTVGGSSEANDGSEAAEGESGFGSVAKAGFSAGTGIPN
jgi:hypothetical protein